MNFNQSIQFIIMNTIAFCFWGVLKTYAQPEWTYDTSHTSYPGHVAIGLINPNTNLSVANRATIISTSTNTTSIDLKGENPIGIPIASMNMNARGIQRLYFTAEDNQKKTALIHMFNDSNKVNIDMRAQYDGNTPAAWMSLNDNGNSRLAFAARGSRGEAALIHMRNAQNKVNIDMRAQYNSNFPAAWMSLNDNGSERISFAAQNGQTQKGGLIHVKNNNSKSTVNLIGDIGNGTGQVRVDGVIFCEELQVKLSENWPDYVFSQDYNLMPLEELAQHIQKEKHLPGIPSADEIANAGIAVGEMQRKMLEKIEELTLYMIELKGEIDVLKTENHSLKK